MQRRKERYLRTDFNPLWATHSCRFSPDLFDGEPQLEGSDMWPPLTSKFDEFSTWGETNGQLNGCLVEIFSFQSRYFSPN